MTDTDTTETTEEETLAIAAHPEPEGRLMFWEGAGVSVPAGMSVADALKRAEMTWTVEERDVFVRLGNNGKASDFKKLPDRKVLVRSDTGDLLADVSRRYHVLQTEDLLGIADGFSEAGAPITALGMFGGGKQVFFTCKLPEHVDLGGEDPTDFYLLGKAGHDGRAAVQLGATAMRLDCTNASNLALARAKVRWSIPHLSTADKRMDEVRDSLGKVDAYVKELDAVATGLMKMKIGDDRARALFAALLPQSSRLDGRVDELFQVYAEDPTVSGYRGTGWGVLQAVTAWDQHHRTSRSGEARMLRTVAGAAKPLADKVLRLLDEAA